MTSAPKNRKLLFHIGHHKTGSTSIQDAFATGRVSVHGQRIYYPGRMNHNYLRQHFDTYVQSGKLLAGSPASPGLKAISQQLKTTDFDIAVISGEEFERANPKSVLTVLQQFMLPSVADHSVICYLRPHAGRILSSFAEDVKVGFFSGTPEDFHRRTLKSGRFFFTEKLTAWSDIFAANFCLRPMVREELKGESVLHDFIHTGIGPDCSFEVTPAPSANEALCLEDLLLVNLLQSCFSDRDRKLRLAMGWQLAPALSALARPKGQRTKLMLHKSLAEIIRSSYIDDAKALDAKFFTGKPLLQTELDRAVDEALPNAQSYNPADHFDAETVRIVKFLGEQINELFEHDSEPWPAFLRERRIERLHKNNFEKPLVEDADQRRQRSLESAPIIPPTPLGVAKNTPLHNFVASLASEPRGHDETIPKIIWIFWNSGFEDAPDVVKKSLATWRHFNSDHDVRALDLDEASRLLGLDLEEVFSEMSVAMGWTGKSDMIRLLLLAKYGGIWVDATTFCLKPLSEWLHQEASSSGFFSFRDVNDKRDHELISWFMAATPNHPVITQTMLDCIGVLFKKREQKIPVTGYNGYRERYGLTEGCFPGREFLLECERTHKNFPYFWMFYLFRDAIRDQPGAREKWMKQSNRYALGKHDMKRFARSFVAKQSYKGRYLESQFYSDRVAALFDGDHVRPDYTASARTDRNSAYSWHEIRRSLQISEARKVVFIHIPKCGGTSVDSSNLFEDGVRRFGHAPLSRYREILGDRISDFRVVTTVRNPWDRLGSAFFFASMEATKFKDANSVIAKGLHAEFGADFGKFLTDFVSNPDRFLSMLWFRPSVWFFDPRSCELPYFVQKLEDMGNLEPLRRFIGFPGFDMGHHRKGPMRERERSAFSQEQFDSVGRIYRDDIEAFQYEATKISDLNY